MKRPVRDLIKCLERHGYEYDRTNSKGAQVYSRGAEEVIVPQGIAEGVAREQIRRLDRANGAAVESNKRNTQAIKERQAARRQALRAEIARDRAERNALIDRRNRRLDGHAAALDNEQVRAIELRIEEREAELRSIERLMTTQSLDNRARHRT